MSGPRHIADRDGVVHRMRGGYVHEAESDFIPLVCGGGIVLPGHAQGGPATCDYCRRGVVEPGWEDARGAL